MTKGVVEIPDQQDQERQKKHDHACEKKGLVEGVNLGEYQADGNDIVVNSAIRYPEEMKEVSRMV